METKGCGPWGRTNLLTPTEKVLLLMIFTANLLHVPFSNASFTSPQAPLVSTGMRLIESCAFEHKTEHLLSKHL